MLALAIWAMVAVKRGWPFWKVSLLAGAATGTRSVGVYNEFDRGKSWPAMILPQIDQAPLYNSIRFEADLTDPANDRAASMVVATFLCPSDLHGDGVMPNRRNSNVPRAITNYKAVLGSNWNWGDFAGGVSATGRNAGDANGLEACNGFLCRGGDLPPLTTRFRDVTDGASSTFALGEAVPEWCWHTWWYWFNASTATCAIPLNYKQVPESGLDDWFNNYAFASRHVGGGHFCLVDGSVRFVSENINRTVYGHLATIQGEEPIGEF